MAQLRTRLATCAVLDVMIDWAAAEGWNPGLDDADAIFAADPEGFLMAELENNNGWQ